MTGGYTHAERWRVVFADGSRGFLKRAVDDETAEWLRREARIYRALRGSTFLPRMVSFDDGDRPSLVLEDLGGAHWPPTWRPGDVERVVAALDAVHATPPPGGLVPVDLDHLSGWHQVAEDPTPFLGLGLVTPRWLQAALPALVAAETEPSGEEQGLCHCDTRSDNLCFDSDRTLIVDWNCAAIGPRSADGGRPRPGKRPGFLG